MDNKELFNKATPFSQIDLKSDNPQIETILDEIVVIEGFFLDGNATIISVVKESGESLNIWSSSKVVNDTLNKIPKSAFPIKATFREFTSGKSGFTYYGLE